MTEPPEFWAAAADGRLVVQRCSSCGYLRWPPGPVCPECLSRGTDWVDVADAGTLISYAVYHRQLAPDFHRRVPYTVGYVQLEDGPRLYGLIDDGAPITVGAQVRAVFPGDDRMIEWKVIDSGV